MTEETKPIRILLCVDSSIKAENAFEFYREKLHKPEQELIIMHVSDCVNIPAVHLMSEGVAFNKDDIQRKTDVIRQKNKVLENKYNTKCREYRIKHKVITVSGEDGIGNAIVSNAERYSVSLVVMGTRGLSKLKRTFLGSVSDYVLHHSNVPVLVCPSQSH